MDGTCLRSAIQVSSFVLVERLFSALLVQSNRIEVRHVIYSESLWGMNVLVMTDLSSVRVIPDHSYLALIDRILSSNSLF